MSAAPLVALRAEFERCRTMDASLGDRLAAYSNEVRNHIPEYANAVDDLVARLRRQRCRRECSAVRFANAALRSPR